MKDLGSKTVLDAFTCVECGRCQVNCPAWGAGKDLNPKTLILQTQDALLAGKRETKLGEIYSEEVLWQCTTCGACENQCPVGHRAYAAHHRREARAGVERRRARLHGRRLQPPRARGRTSGASATTSARSSSTRQRSKPSIPRSTTCSCGWAVPAPSRPTSRSRCGRSSRSCGPAAVRFGVLSKERCTGDVAKRTGNEYMFQELAQRRTSRTSRPPARRRSSRRVRTA